MCTALPKQLQALVKLYFSLVLGVSDCISSYLIIAFYIALLEYLVSFTLKMKHLKQYLVGVNIVSPMLLFSISGVRSIKNFHCWVFLIPKTKAFRRINGDISIANGKT